MSDIGFLSLIILVDICPPYFFTSCTQQAYHMLANVTSKKWSYNPKRKHSLHHSKHPQFEWQPQWWTIKCHHIELKQLSKNENKALLIMQSHFIIYPYTPGQVVLSWPSYQLLTKNDAIFMHHILHQMKQIQPVICDCVCGHRSSCQNEAIS